MWEKDWEKKHQEASMNVVYVSNENYVRHMAASMVSLFERNQGDKQLTVYVFSIKIKKETKRKLCQMADRYHREISWVELGDLRTQFGFELDTGGFDASIMGRLFVGRLLPESVRRVLYLDCDTIIMRSLGRLWNTNLRGNVMGAVMEPTIYKPVKQVIGLGEEDAYVNSGVLLIDLERWRELQVEEQLVDFYQKRVGSLFACDQDVLNGVLKGHICFLSPEYNFCTNYRYLSYRELLRYGKTYQAVGKQAFAKAKHHPAILHYAGDERPWIAGNRNHYRKAYENALALTPWAGTPKEKGQEWYMAAYHLMNYTTAICPPIRRIISRKLGMKVREARKKETPVKNIESIAVLLATYQGESYVKEQLDSILAQTIPNISIVISDDGSCDKTRQILETYEKTYPNQIFLRHRVKKGAYQDREPYVPAPAMNFFWLMSQVQADYILFSDQDDVWYPEKVETLLERMKEVEGKEKTLPVLVYSDMEVTDGNLNPICSSFFSYSKSSPRRTSLRELLVENPVTGGAVMMNRPLAELAASVPESCFMHDWWVALCASCFGGISCIEKPLSQYRQHGHNVMGARNTGSIQDLKERIVRKKQVEENYCRMFLQAEAFLKQFGKQMDASQRMALEQFLALPAQTPISRIYSIFKYGFIKTSWIQTIAQAVTIPGKAKRKLLEGADQSPKPVQMRVYCVILNYKDAETVQKLVKQIENYSCLEGIVIVDNHSPDDSWEKLQTLNSQKVSLIQAEKNGGYGAGNNLGVWYAVEKKGATHVIIANPDVSFSESCICGLKKIFAKYPDAGAAAARMEDKAYKNFQNGWKHLGFAGQLLRMGPVSRRLFGWCLSYPPSYYKNKKAVPVDEVHGSMVMVHGKAFLDWGGYDEEIFLYQEESVLGDRLKKAGYFTALLLTESYSHSHSVSINKSFEDELQRQKLREASLLYYMKHYLHIGPVREKLAKAWFWGIRMEIRIVRNIQSILPCK